jgi:hypothetical protein
MFAAIRVPCRLRLERRNLRATERFTAGGRHGVDPPRRQLDYRQSDSHRSPSVSYTVRPWDWSLEIRSVA